MANNTTQSLTTDRANVDELESIEIAMLMLSCVIAVISNTFVLYLILTVRRLKTVTNVFVFSICVCNVMFALVLLPMHCFYMKSLAYEFIVIITVLVYICNLTAVSYDRLVSITKPMLYTLKQTKRKAIKIVIVMWILPLCYCLLPLIWIRGWIHNNKALVHKIYTATTLILFLLGPLVFIVFVYVKVCLEMKKMNTFKKKKLTPTQSIFSHHKKNKKGNGISELKKLPQIILNNMRKASEERTQNVTAEEQTNFVKNDVASGNNCRVTFVSIPDTPDSNIACRELIKAALGRSDLQTECSPVSEYDIVDNEDDSDADTISVNSRKKCSFADVTSSPSVPLARKRQSSISHLKRKAYEVKASLAFLIVAITYMFTWLPVCALTFNSVLDDPVALPQSLSVMSLYAIALNALSDPFLYGLLLPNFRKTLKLLIRRLTMRVN